ncbi:MAG TPA: amidohydrolase family protein [Clostridiales bacterium]|nr:amidohydrolase family protein [Clostridiales bacterium]
MIIDFHTHCIVDDLYAKTLAQISREKKVYPSFDGSINGLIRSMQNAGIDRSVVVNYAAEAITTIKVNSFAIKCASYQELIPFGSIHPDFKDYKSEIDRLVQNNIRGLKFHPHLQSFAIDDPKMMKLYEYALSKDMALLFHMGKNQQDLNCDNASPKHLRALIDAFNTPKIIAAHMGGQEYKKEFEKYILGKTVSFETSCAFTQMKPEEIEFILNNHNNEYILFGTDSPWAHQSDELLQYYSFNIPINILEMILGDNAKRLLEI